MLLIFSGIIVFLVTFWAIAKSNAMRRAMKKITDIKFFAGRCPAPHKLLKKIANTLLAFLLTNFHSQAIIHLTFKLNVK